MTRKNVQKKKSEEGEIRESVCTDGICRNIRKEVSNVTQEMMFEDSIKHLIILYNKVIYSTKFLAILSMYILYMLIIIYI